MVEIRQRTGERHFNDILSPPIDFQNKSSTGKFKSPHSEVPGEIAVMRFHVATTAIRILELTLDHEIWALGIGRVRNCFTQYLEILIVSCGRYSMRVNFHVVVLPRCNERSLICSAVTGPNAMALPLGRW